MRTKRARFAHMEPAKIFGQQLRLVRMRRGWSQQDLVDRLSQLGFPVDRSAIAKIETGARGVSVDEALAIAVALDVAPTALLVPRRPGDSVQVVPVVEAHDVDAMAWFEGRCPMIVGDESDDELRSQARFYFEEVPDFRAEERRVRPGLHAVSQIIDIASMQARHSDPSHLESALHHLEDARDRIEIEIRHIQRELRSTDQGESE